MLDGLLGRSVFYTKSKSLIKQTRTRIEVVQRKRNATIKFLRNDIAHLLSNGLDSNAFSRADGVISELILSSCYDFVDHVCEIILKHLPVLQKLRECPEDCREAVASLMFAAARFSDLPELRDLRDLFQGRYGSSLECFVNHELVENLTPKPTSVEKKIQLLQDIALEFSIRWNGLVFQERMSISAAEKKQAQNPETLYALNKVATQAADGSVQKKAKDEALMKKRSDTTSQKKEKEVDRRYQMETGCDSAFGRRDDVKYNVYRKPESTKDNIKSPYREELIQKQEKRDIPFQKRDRELDEHDFRKSSVEEAIQGGCSSRGRRPESVDSEHRRDRLKPNPVPEKDLPSTFPPPKPDVRSNHNSINSPSPVNVELAEDVHVKSMIKRQDDVTDGLKSHFRGGIPPPYSKPRRGRHKTDVDGHTTENDTLTFKPASNRNRAENLLTKADSPDLKVAASTVEKDDGPAHFTEIYYRDESGVEFTPRRRSHRRKHSRSSSIQDDKVIDEERVLRRVSTSRRKHESRKGLQILVADDELHKKDDEEEKIIDKLLLHYSKKPASIDPGKLRRKTGGNEMKHQQAVDGTVDEDSTTTATRSFSLPSKHVTELKPEVALTRAASFQQDTPANHVHPKLPDYDDLAARFAALRAPKG